MTKEELKEYKANIKKEQQRMIDFVLQLPCPCKIKNDYGKIMKTVSDVEMLGLIKFEFRREYIVITEVFLDKVYHLQEHGNTESVMFERKELTEEEIIQVDNLLNEGNTIVRIAEILNLKYDSVYWRCKLKSKRRVRNEKKTLPRRS